VHREDDAHDADDAALLRELARLRTGGGDVAREREIVAILIGGWEPIFKGWLVSRIGRQDGEEVGERIVVRLVELLVRERKITAAWGACVWRIVRDEAFRYYRGREQSPERLVPEVYADPDAVPADDPLEELPLDPQRDAARLTELVKELSQRDQRVIELTVLEERPRPEAAALLGLTVNALNQARHRAVEHLATLAAAKGVSAGGNSDEETA
jgi:DNA-directed RNA polymerase specialized sigma24 family protein